MSCDASLFLADMRSACAAILRHTRGIDRQTFFADERRRDAVLWNLLVLGEATKRVPDAVRQDHPAIEWRKMAAFRDVLAHGAFCPSVT